MSGKQEEHVPPPTNAQLLGLAHALTAGAGIAVLGTPVAMAVPVSVSMMCSAPFTSWASIGTIRRRKSFSRSVKKAGSTPQLLVTHCEEDEDYTGGDGEVRRHTLDSPEVFESNLALLNESKDELSLSGLSATQWKEDDTSSGSCLTMDDSPESSVASPSQDRKGQLVDRHNDKDLMSEEGDSDGDKDGEEEGSGVDDGAHRERKEDGNRKDDGSGNAGGFGNGTSNGRGGGQSDRRGGGDPDSKERTEDDTNPTSVEDKGKGGKTRNHDLESTDGVLTPNGNHVGSNHEDTPRPPISIESFAEFSSVPCNRSSTMVVMAEIKVSPHDSEESRSPLDLVAVVDRSSSMLGKDLFLVQSTLKFMISIVLQPTDRLCVVSYAEDVAVNLPLTEMTEEGKAKALEAVQTIFALGPTNLSGGLFRGLEELVRDKRADSVASLLLFTDGHANCGLRKQEEIVVAVQGYIAQIPNGCSIFTFGYGSDHDSVLLDAIATAANSVYYFVEDEDSILQHFADCLGGLVSVVAQNVVMELCPGEGCDITRVMTKSGGTRLDDGSFRVEIGDMYAEESKDIPCLVRLLPSGEDEHFPVMKFEVTYFDATNLTRESTSSVAKIHRTPNGTEIGEGDSFAVKVQRLRVHTAQALEKASKLEQDGKREEAKQCLVSVITQIEATPTEASSAEGVALLRNLKDCLKQLERSTRAMSMLQSAASSHFSQRSRGGLEYRTRSKTQLLAMSSDFQAMIKAESRLQRIEKTSRVKSSAPLQRRATLSGGKLLSGGQLMYSSSSSDEDEGEHFDNEEVNSRRTSLASTASPPNDLLERPNHMKRSQSVRVRGESHDGPKVLSSSEFQISPLSSGTWSSDISSFDSATALKAVESATSLGRSRNDIVWLCQYSPGVQVVAREINLLFCPSDPRVIVTELKEVLSHSSPLVVPCLGVTWTSESIFCFFEYIEGVSMTNWLKELTAAAGGHIQGRVSPLVFNNGADYQTAMSRDSPPTSPRSPITPISPMTPLTPNGYGNGNANGNEKEKDSVVSRSLALDGDTLRPIARSLLMAMEELHPTVKQPIGIRPSSIFLSSEGQVKVEIDPYHSSKTLRDHTHSNTYTSSSGQMTERLTYISPESLVPISERPSTAAAAEKEGEANAEAGKGLAHFELPLECAEDVWALGALLLTALLGHSPWTVPGQKTPMMVQLNMILATDGFPKQFEAALAHPFPRPREFRDFLDKCLRNDPAKRWAPTALLGHPYLSRGVGDEDDGVELVNMKPFG